MSFPRTQDITSNLSQNIQQYHKEAQMSYFNDVITEAGIILNNYDAPNTVSQEQSLVIRDIEKIIKSNISFPNNIKEFINGLKFLCRKEMQMKNALKPTYLKKITNVDAILNTINNNIQQESLFRILLNINCLQNEIIEILLDKITTHAVTDVDDTSFIHLLLNNLKYLSYIKNPETLTNKLLDVLDVATHASQIEIFNAIPEIIPNSQYDETGKQLAKILQENADLAGAIIDCLNSLSLNDDIKFEIQESILSKLTSPSLLKVFPILFEFLVTDCKTQNLNNILLKCRNAIDIIMSKTNQNDETESNKVIVIAKLYSIIATIKPTGDTLINIIGNFKVHSDYKPIDFIILFILHSTVKPKRKIIENLIRKQVKLGLIKITLLECMFEKYLTHHITKHYLDTIITIGSNLLRTTNEHTSTEFTITYYKLLFNHKYVNRIQRHDILSSLIQFTGMNEQKCTGIVLKILAILVDENKLIMQQHVTHLMIILENLDNFNLNDVKQLFDLLYSLVCEENADDMSGYKNELDILVRKQLSSIKNIIKHKGIVSAVIIIKHLVTINNDESNVEIKQDSTLTLADLPSGPAQEAAILLELTNTSIISCIVSRGLYYDELATLMMTSIDLNKYFMAWLFETITNDFQNGFVTETIPDPINDIEMSVQYSLNTSEEMEVPISINIAEMTLKPQHFERKSILILAPFFRLLRLLHYKHNKGDLTSIDALLGCGILMPNTDDINNMDTYQIKQVADCLFHCINWFREVISGFIKQKSRTLRNKVLERVNNLIELEEKLNEIISNIPEHKFPISYFNKSSEYNGSIKKEKLKPPTKKFKSNEIAASSNFNETIASTIAQVIKNKTTKKVIQEMNLNFREMDADIIILLKYSLKLNDTVSAGISSSQVITINIKQFQFILKDFVVKLNKTLMRCNKNFNTTEPKDLINNCIHLLPSINNHFNTIAKYLKKLLEQNDGQYDSPELFTNETNNLKVSYGLVLECFSYIFSWSGFQHISNLNLLKDCLKALRGQTTSQLNSAKRLIVDYVNNIINYTEQCLYLSCAINLIKIIEALHNINNNTDVQKKLVNLSNKFLMRKWYNLNGKPDTGKEYNSQTEYLVKIYLSGADVKTIYGLVGTLQNEVANLKTKEDCLDMLTSINKTNFHVFFRVLCEMFLEKIRSEITSLTNDEHMILWRTTALTMQGLMTIVQVQNTHVNLGCFLKKSIMILKLFISHGIPILEIMLRSKPDQVTEIFKIMQTSTRFLHHLCCYSKMVKNTTLMAHVPKFRSTLEMLVYRVRAALTANNCSEAFWIGNLRNKDLEGQDILSQNTTESEDNDQDDVEDEEDDDDTEERFETNEDSSASEIF